ncbi:hypothetical protein [Blastomonas fulva]|uniref:hypothetical protein n=1 Tax=Blastomonas fulva TaxID=1550728 RepID=UPI003D276005
MTIILLYVEGVKTGLPMSQRIKKLHVKPHKVYPMIILCCVEMSHYIVPAHYATVMKRTLDTPTGWLVANSFQLHR